MAAPGFGFSFGDFVSAINIAKDICRALRATGGAKDEFQHVLTDLQHLTVLLEQLDDGAWNHGGDASHLNSIKCMALTCKAPLQEFRKKLDKYKVLQGTSVLSFKIRLGAEARKVQWAISMKEEVEKFRAVITSKIVSINLLIHLHTLSTVSKLGSAAEPLVETYIPFQIKIQNCRDDIQQLSGEMKKMALEQSNTKEIVSTLVRICTGNKVGVEHFRHLNGTQHKEIQRRFDELKTLNSRGQVIMKSNSEAINRLENRVQQLMVVLIQSSTTMLKLVGLALRIDLKNYALLRDMHSTILRAPVFGNQDSIRFTDALGRTEPLPYRYFQHWDVFEAMLRCKFKQLPGERLVAQGQYHLLDTKRKDLVINRRRWERSVFPGADISMSMIILGVLFNKESCPRVACGARNVQHSIESAFITCSKCHLEYRCLDIYVQREPSMEAAVDQKGISPTAGARDMHRIEGFRPQTEIEHDDLNFPMPPDFEHSVEEELEAFKSIHIQTKPRSELSNEKQLEKNDNNTVPGTIATEENNNIQISCPPGKPDQPLSFPPAPESLVGRVLGQSLEIKSIIRTTVNYLALHIATELMYAVKALPKFNPDGKPQDRRQRAFQTREIRLHYAASAHPNIVSMLKIVDDPDYTFVVFNYCPDGDLFSNITERGLYVGNDPLIRAAFLQILSAVQHCHRLGIYHRYLNPENILVNGTDVFLDNFALATTDAESDDHGCGVVYYMSPECLEGSGMYQCAPNDVWSLGVILVNLTCGRNPWKQPSLLDNTYKAYLRNRNILRSFLPLSKELNDILVTIFEPDAEKRITIEELITAITDCPTFSAPSVTV